MSTHDETADLAERQCVPCKGGVPPLDAERIHVLLGELDGDWTVVAEHHLEKMYTFDSYAEATDFAVTVAGIAEEQNHHPDILLTYGKVKVTVWTHKVDGLTLSDFIFAAKVEKAFADRD